MKKINVDKDDFNLFNHEWYKVKVNPILFTESENTKT